MHAQLSLCDSPELSILGRSFGAAMHASVAGGMGPRVDVCPLAVMAGRTSC